MTTILLAFVACFLFLLVIGYLLPAGLMHWFVTRDPEIRAARIQDRLPRRQDVEREVRHSLSALVLFSAYCVPLLWAYREGMTAVYLEPGAYPLWWLPVSVVVAALLHDTWFYWTHRLMHVQPFFRLMHAGHHRSITPTPWAILSFQPLETVPQFAFFALVILLVPMHPAALLAYLVIDGIVNAAGHCGHELMPRWMSQHRLLRYLNAVTHHDLHHSRFRYNFSQYLNIWDRLMGTYLDVDAADRARTAARLAERPSTRFEPSLAQADATSTPTSL